MTDRRDQEPQAVGSRETAPKNVDGQKQIMGLRQEDHLPKFPTAAVSEAYVPML